MKEKILLFMTDFYNYYKEIIRSIENNGYEVVWIDDKVKLHFFEEISNKVFKNTYQIKFDKYFNDKLNEVKDQNFSKIIIIFGANSFKQKHILDLRRRFANTPIIYYARDSAANFPEIKNLIRVSDKAFSFDPYDAKKYDAVFLPLFYIDFNDGSQECLYNISTVMSLYQEKIKDLKRILPIICNYDNININLIIRSKISYLKLLLKNPYFIIKYRRFIKLKSIPLNQVNEIFSASKVIVDCPIENQKGLTMRTFETLSKRKKLITTNCDIKNYPFYTMNNIRVVGEDEVTKEFIHGQFDGKFALTEEYGINCFVKKLLGKE